MFSIGAFSRLTQLSVRVLRHYDEIGLLKPADVDPVNGYRSYSADQLADAQRIVALKELGLSLDQVGRVLQEHCSVEMIQGMLRLEQARAEQVRVETERRLRELGRRLAELDDLGRLSEIDIIEKSVEATPYLSFRARMPELSDAYTLMNDITVACAKHRRGTALIGVLHDRFFDTRDLDIELGFPMGNPERVDLGEGRVMTVRELPRVERMLSVVYRGDQEEGHRRCHHALGLWLDAHACDFDGPSRELIYAPNETEVDTIEIQYPITARGVA